MRAGLKNFPLLIFFVSLFFLFPNFSAYAQTAGQESTIDGAVLYQYEPADTDGVSFLKGPGVLNGIIYPAGATKIDKLYIFFHSVNPPCKDCHKITPLEVCTEFKLCEEVALIPTLDPQTYKDIFSPTKNIAILIPQMNPQSGNNVSASQFTKAKFQAYLNEALAHLRSKISDTPTNIYVVASHGAGAGIAAKYMQLFKGADEALVFEGCYSDWCQQILDNVQVNKKIFYIDKNGGMFSGIKSTIIGINNSILSTRNAEIKEVHAQFYQMPEKCFLDHILDNGCVATSPKQPSPTEVDAILEKINNNKPKLEIDFQGIQFATVTVNTDQVGDNYIIIPWIAQFISTLYKFGVVISSIIAVIIIIIQGVRIIISGDGEQKTEGYKKIGHALIGLFIAWGSFAILYNINPNLVEFNGLKVKVVEEIPLETNDIILEDDTSSTPPLPSGAYDSIFSQYANCVGIDWRILRMIAKAESNLTPDLINKAGFIGFFQTKPKNCRGVFGKKYAKYADQCTEENLKTPAFNTAVGALYQKDSLNFIDTYCKNAPINIQLTVFYSVLSSGAGATKNVLKYASQHGGCTETNLRIGFTKFWHDYKGGASARWFVNYMKPGYCQEFTDPLDCMGSKKFDHTLKAANGLVGQGITSVRAQPTGLCPLDTNTPFPSP